MRAVEQDGACLSGLSGLYGLGALVAHSWLADRRCVPLSTGRLHPPSGWLAPRAAPPLPHWFAGALLGQGRCRLVARLRLYCTLPHATCAREGSRTTHGAVMHTRCRTTREQGLALEHAGHHESPCPTLLPGRGVPGRVGAVPRVASRLPFRARGSPASSSHHRGGHVVAARGATRFTGEPVAPQPVVYESGSDDL